MGAFSEMEILSRFLIIAFLWTVVINPGSALAASWEKTIISVEKKADLYFEKGRILGGLPLGSAHGSYRMDEHQCVILGYMLNKRGAIEHLDKPTKQALVTGDDYILEATSLDNWVHMARHLNDKEDDFKIKLWNRECVGKMGISVSSSIPEASLDAFYQLNDDGETLIILGNVTRGYHERLLAALEANKGVKEVALGSDGGSVVDALKSGVEIRKRRLSTVLYGDCLSACPLVFFGGTKRIVWSPHAKLGFHKIYTSDGLAIPKDDKLYELLRNYLRAMGIDQFTVMKYIFSAEPDEMFFPNVMNYCDGNVVTWAQRVCGG